MSEQTHDEIQQPELPPVGGYAPPEDPRKKFVFDLDAVDEERHDDEVLFATKLRGREIVLINPKDVDWQDLLYLGENPDDFIELCIEDEETKEWFLAQKIKGRTMERLIEAFTRHYGIGDERRGGRGNRRASRR